MIENNELIVRVSFLGLQEISLGRNNYLFVESKDLDRALNKNLKVFAQSDHAKNKRQVKIVSSEKLSFHPSKSIIIIKTI